MHGEFGRLTVDGDGTHVQCHICGGWYKLLANHVRLTHGYEPDEYREEFGLNKTVALAAPELCAQRAAKLARQVAERGLLHEFTPSERARGYTNPALHQPRREQHLLDRQQAATFTFSCKRCGRTITIPRRGPAKRIYCDDCRVARCSERSRASEARRRDAGLVRRKGIGWVPRGTPRDQPSARVRVYPAPDVAQPNAFRVSIRGGDWFAVYTDANGDGLWREDGQEIFGAAEFSLRGISDRRGKIRKWLIKSTE